VLADFQLKPQKAEAIATNKDIVDLKSLEANMIRKALQNYNYNQQATADSLGIHRDALGRKLKKYNININKSEG
jgi:transcriptional regulator with PAS, ATPase and Fis domain